MPNIEVVVTGGCGFVGHHFIEHILKNTNWSVVCVDKLSYSSFGYDRLRDISVYDDRRVHIVNHDFVEPVPEGILHELKGARYFVHMAAETHVDNSITDPLPFIRSNVLGTHHAAQAALKLGVEKFIYFSTDEVYGAAPQGIFFSEDDPLNPSNPYAAAKLGGWALVNAYINTYSLPALTTRTMNIFGERQYPEKFIPMVIRKIRDGQSITIHADPTCTIPGSRVYLHARNASAAVLFCLQNGSIGEIYNIVGDEEIDNLTLAKKIGKIMGKPVNYKMVDFHSSRPGHDLRYAMSGQKLADLGFSYPKDLDSSLAKMIEWTLEHPKWIE